MLTVPAMRLRLGSILLVPALLALGACTTPAQKADSILKPSQMSPDSVALEIFFIRVPLGDAEVNGKLWNEIDEQPLAPDLRERLARNGFRAGLLGGQVPDELAKLLELADKPVPTGQVEGVKVEQMDAEPRVVRRRLQLRTGQRSEILASSVYPQLPVLVYAAGQLSGQTYDDAQGVFAAKSFPQPDGRVRLELVPELHYGQPRQRWVGGQGMGRLDTSRAKQIYDDMTLTADLSPGAMLVLTSLPNRSGSLGHHFFTQSDPRLEQKLLLVRLAQTQHDGLFAPPEALKLEE
jgi:hypothetical protein